MYACNTDSIKTESIARHESLQVQKIPKTSFPNLDYHSKHSVELNSKLKKSILNAKELEILGKKLGKILSKHNRQETLRATDINSITQELEPMIQSGNAIRNDMVGYLISTGEYFNLPTEEINAINNMSGDQLAELSFGVSTMYLLPPLPEDECETRIRSCIGVALGLNGLKDIITQITTVGSVRTGIQLLKFVGRRYLGYIGVAWMIWDFTDCMRSLSVAELKPADNYNLV